VTNLSTGTRWRTPVVSVAATVAVLTALLVIQHLRHGWPFSLHMQAPAQTPITGAALPVDSAVEGRAMVEVEEQQMDAVGLRLETVRTERVTRPLRAVAVVVPDESRIAHAHTRVAGWVEELLIDTTGEVVRTGQPLARVFSQELLSSQTEYLAARRHAAAGISSVVVESGRARLQVLGMTEAEIAGIESSAEPMRLVTVVAPASGVVLHRGISVGTSVDPSTELITIADLSTVWVVAEIPEAEGSTVSPGTHVELDFPGSGRAPFAAAVEFVYPTLSERTRTLRVRMSVPNRSGELRPGQYGTATLETAERLVLSVPRDAVVDTGRSQHVFVADESGRFEPRLVHIGARLGDRVEIRSGVAEGEEVVAAGVFLIDSESRLRASGGGTGHLHGAGASDGESAAGAADRHAGNHH
jgi:Cu(I)/Ag(I) efflux system membrane fusion protein